MKCLTISFSTNNVNPEPHRRDRLVETGYLCCMNYHFQDLLPADFAKDSKVWIYQCSRQFTFEEVITIDELLTNFANTWLTHGIKVKGYANSFFGQFIIFIADESSTGVSGCSTDSSVRLVKNIEQDYCVHLFERQNLAFIVNERIQLIPLNQLNSAIEENIVIPDTLYFNNTVQTLSELESKWILSIKDSWLSTRIINCVLPN